ncbi:MAG: ATP-binding cassette domain-containing protein [Actinomycetota bacterium]|nr:ATP-binding cassette domain-containing protein [Actinomycetota bacterium]MDQ3573813.1 ATP-binding cassette domain-containing protein [Actinomycetota bacterium]
MIEPALELRHVRRVFRRRTLRGEIRPVVAVDDVSLELRPGEIVGLVGGSGAGKSTLGRMIIGLERPDAGEVRFEGQNLSGLREGRLRGVRRRMHLVLQDPYESLHPGMRVVSAVAEPLIVAGVAARERVERAAAALEEVGLVPVSGFLRRFPHELSGGQRQRVALARAFVAHPRVAVADEPTSMLDASVRAGILELILGIRDRLGTAFVFITHDLAVARYVSDRLAVLHEGRLIECGETDEVISSPQQEYTRTLLAASEGKL